VPKTFEIVAELPILPSGKVDRRALTHRAAVHQNNDQRTEIGR
jgi:acyl-CoA synthetase (AMP-forming)/AMP-acid ligase II